MSRAQASETNYELQSLGWKSFQDLCATITSEILGQTVQVFLTNRDGGRDGAFQGQWDPHHGSGVKGTFTIQCKFSSKEVPLSASAVREELEKSARLAKKGLASNYILMTNVSVSGLVEAALREQFLAIQGIDYFVLFGKEWITLRIRESPALRMLVPRVYGIGDLSQILDERAYSQAKQILSSLGDDLAKFVVTQPHVRAARAIAQHGFVLLLGEPAAGKSTIAAALAIGALDRWGCSTLKISSASEFVQHWNANDPRQFFWVDDAFGTTQYQRELVSEWNRVWPHMTAAIRKGARVLFTSRDYIYRAARSDVKATAFPLINESQVVINVQRLFKPEKEQILYNHVKLGGQPRTFRTHIKPFLRDIASNSRFLPEIARRLGSPLFTKTLSFDPKSVRTFVEEPLSFLIEVVMTLDAGSRAALALVFMRGGKLESPIELAANEEAALGILGVPLAVAREALVALDGSLVSLVRSADRSTWTFKHPTIGDAYGSIVAEDPELLDIYMSWTSPEKLVAEVTCGDVGLEGVKVVVPSGRFKRFADRLEEVKPGKLLFTFLATRCSAQFLDLYLARHPELGDLICEPGSRLSEMAEVDLLVKLFQVGLLPEEWRRRFVGHAEELALTTPDLDFLTIEPIRALFRAEELQMVVTRIRDVLVPNLSSFVYDFRSNYDDNADPGDWFYPLSEVLDTLTTEFVGDAGVAIAIAEARGDIEEAVQRILQETPTEGDDRDYGYEGRTIQDSVGDRSVFDDIDE